LTVAEKLIEFIQKNRRVLVTVFIVIVVGLVGSLVGLTVREKLITRAFIQLDEFEQRHLALAGNINADGEEQPDVDALLGELEAFAAGNSRFPAARAHAIRASVFQEQQRWALARQAWLDAANAAPQTYFAPVALWNAAVAAEESGDPDAAIALHARIVQDHESAFFIAARSQFSIGRLEESRGGTDAAIAAYQSLVGKWPQDTHADFAQSRIIVLSY